MRVSPPLPSSTLRESQLLPPFTRARSSVFTLTSRALGTFFTPTCVCLRNSNSRRPGGKPGALLTPAPRRPVRLPPTSRDSCLCSLCFSLFSFSLWRSCSNSPSLFCLDFLSRFSFLSFLPLFSSASPRALGHSAGWLGGRKKKKKKINAGRPVACGRTGGKPGAWHTPAPSRPVRPAHGHWREEEEEEKN